MDQTEKPIKTQQQHPEEEEHHENGASKMFRKVKARAKKFIAKHGQSQEHDDQDVVEEDDEDDEIGTPVKGGVTGQHVSLSHPKEANVPAPEEIIPPGTKVFPAVSSDNIKPIKPVSLQDTSYGHEALSDPVRTTDTSEKEEKREEPTHLPLRVSELSNREESREAHHEALNTPVSLPSATEDVTTTVTPRGENEYLGGQRKVNVESPKKLEEDPVAPGGGSDYLSGVSNHQSKVNDPTHEGSGEAEIPEIGESPDKKSGLGFERDLSTKSKEFKEFDRQFESVVGKDSPARFAGESGAELEKDVPTRSHEFDMKTESGVDKSGLGFERDLSTKSKEFKEFDRQFESVVGKDSPARFAGESGAELEKDVPTRSHEFDMKTESGVDKNSPSRSHEFDMKTESGIDKNSPSRSHEFDLKTEYGINKNSTTGFGGESKTGLEEDSPTRSYESDQKTESEINKNSTAGLGNASILGLGEDFPAKSHELGLKNESGSGKDSPMGFGGESGTSPGEDIPVKESHGYGERSYESDQKTESEINKNSTAGIGSASIVGPEEDFPAKSHELGLKNESGIGKDSPMGFGGESGTSLGEDIPVKESHGYGEEPEAELEKTFPSRSDDVKVETELGRDLPTGTYDQFSPDISRPKETDDFKESRDAFEETRDEPKPSTYTDQFASKNAVAAKLGYSGESPVKDETQVAGTFDEKLTPINETGSTVKTELPLSGGASGLEETQQGEVDKGVSSKNYLEEKLTPGEEDKDSSEVTAEKLHLEGGEKKETMTNEKIPNEKELENKEHGEAVTEEVKGGAGMVGMIKGWFGAGATEEVKPKSPNSVEESSQSLGSTVGTMGFPDSGGSELGKTGGGTGAVPVQRELGN